MNDDSPTKSCIHTHIHYAYIYLENWATPHTTQAITPEYMFAYCFAWCSKALTQHT